MNVWNSIVYNVQFAIEIWIYVLGKLGYKKTFILKICFDFFLEK